jgi:hypothetical protein
MPREVPFYTVTQTAEPYTGVHYVYLGEPQSRGRRLRVDSTWSRLHSLLKNSWLEVAVLEILTVAAHSISRNLCGFPFVS